MTCEEYLHLLSTSPVEEVTLGRAGDHLGTCAECNRMTTLVVARERNMVTALHGVWSQVQPADTARHAMLASRRQQLGWLKWVGGVLAVVLVVGAVVIPRLVMSANEGLITQTFTLRCLAGNGVIDLIRSEVQSEQTQLMFNPQFPRSFRMRGTPDEIARARALIQEYDNPGKATCLVVPGTVRVP